MLTTNENQIGNIIKESRKNKKFTQLEVATKADISRNYLCDIENNRYMPSVKVLINLAKILQFDLNSICKMTEIQVTNKREM